MKYLLNSVVCYNNHEEIISYAKELSKLENSEVLILIITINKLSDENIQLLKNNLSKIDLQFFIHIINKNVGYMNGMLFGIKKYLTIFPKIDYEYVLFTNTDISFPSKDFIIKLINKKYDKNYWLIGPAIFVPNKRTYSNPICDSRRTLKKINRLIFIFKTPILNTLYFLLSKIKRNFKKIKKGNSKEVYEVHGSFMITNKELVLKLIKDPYNAILYSEETYIAENVYQSNKKAFYDIDLEVNHHEHSVTKYLNIKRTNKFIADSLETIKKDFYNDKLVS